MHTPIALTLLASLLTSTSPTHAQLLPPGAQVERVATGFNFTEGPALGPDGRIYFSDLPNRKVHRFDPATSETTVFLEDSGGSNGLAFDPEGNLVLCEDRDRRLSTLSLAAPAERRVIAEHTLVGDMTPRKLNSPNDLDITQSGLVFFSDPRFGKRDTMELDFEAVYVVPLTGAEHGPLPIIRDVERPNGVALSPDERTLYVADNKAGLIYAYTLRAPGETGEPIQDRRAFAKPPEGTKGGPDGMTVDRAGNLYAAWYGDAAVHAWSPAGEPLARIEIPRDNDKPIQPTNVEFAQDGETLYITAGGSLYRVTLDVPSPR